ncbi:PREDICTED: zinc finger CCCH domain-containing protein 15 homolog [Nelumbo nucifera]|uniref:Zinc finger CCCH domain-containing protein 15 homolog n=1 Tax=Nelumbo nucifera TaxID=4432 RepID=A0A1U8B0W0_NELNU|nr:PREDICTED: zinc finger CCCH domain-containing protein 15 homolog [Nelumbo nucifera]
MGAEEEQKESGTLESRPRTQPMTEAQFLSWKRQKDADVASRREAAARKRAEDIAAGTVQMNGRELFLHEPWVFDNDCY